MTPAELKTLADALDRVFGIDHEFGDDWCYYREMYEVGSALEMIEEMAEEERKWKLRYRKCLLAAGALEEVHEGERTLTAHSSARGRVVMEFKINGKRYTDRSFTFEALDNVSEVRA